MQLEYVYRDGEVLVIDYYYRPATPDFFQGDLDGWEEGDPEEIEVLSAVTQSGEDILDELSVSTVNDIYEAISTKEGGRD